MRYDIYSCDETDSNRFSLGRSGAKSLIAIGLNPSTATRERPDTTVAKVEGVANRAGFEGFVMLNLYPQRATDFASLPQEGEPTLLRHNLDQIGMIIEEVRPAVLWAAWGSNVVLRGYLLGAAIELLDRFSGGPWRQFGRLTRGGHPRHPSRLNYDWRLQPTDASEYRARLLEYWGRQCVRLATNAANFSCGQTVRDI